MNSCALSELDLSREARVCAVALDAREAGWLRAIGLFEGQRVRVLRRAALGGPLHVRTASGGEFAVDRTLARSIRVEPTDAVTVSEAGGAP